MTPSNSINLDAEVKQCSVIKPYEALQSDFAKKLIDHIASNSKFEEQRIGDIMCKLDDETKTLTPEEWKDFLDFIEEHKDFFDAIIKKYKWHFPAWVISEVDSDTLDMKQDDHVLFMDGEYISLDKIKNYIVSLIKWQWTNSESEHYQAGTSKELWRKIERFSVYRPNALHGDSLWYLRDINYSERVNQDGITIHNINGMEFTSMESEETPHLYFTEQDLNNDPDDYSKGRSLGNLNSNPKFVTLLKMSNAKAFESLEESNDFHFKLLQAISNQLWFKDVIDIDFIDDPKNDWKTEMLISGLHSLTGNNIGIPYKFKEGGLISTISCEDTICGVDRDSNTEEGNISFFLEVTPPVYKEQQ